MKESDLMHEAVIVDVVRTPAGRRNGKLKDWHPADLGAHVLKALQERNDLDPSIVDDVVTGCVSQVGEQAFNIGRSAVLAAGWPESVPATTVDRQCGSSQQAIHFAAQGVMAGAYDVVVALGVESMTRTPMGASAAGGELGMPFGPEVFKRYEDTGLPPQGIGADMIADAYGLTREDLDAFSAQSQQRAAQATAEGRFDREKAADLDLKPRARFTNFALAGTDPVTMLKGPIPVTEKIMDKAEITLDDIDLFEINEAFASVVLAWQKETGVSLDKVNVNGGAIALGHPLGCSGAKLMTTLVNELERSGGRYGFQAMCEGGGLANATIIERIDS